jgi:hypothetical protein
MRGVIEEIAPRVKKRVVENGRIVKKRQVQTARKHYDQTDTDQGRKLLGGARGHDSSIAGL